MITLQYAAGAADAAVRGVFRMEGPPWWMDVADRPVSQAELAAFVVSRPNAPAELYAFVAGKRALALPWQDLPARLRVAFHLYCGSLSALLELAAEEAEHV